MTTVLWLALILILFQPLARTYNLTSDDMSLYVRVRDQCIAKSGINGQLVENIDSGMHFPGFEELHCVLECMYEEYGFFDRDGNIVCNNVMNFLALDFDGKEDKLAKKCFGLAGATKCETSYEVHKCIIYYVNHLNEL